jgi:hypothetical protein
MKCTEFRYQEIWQNSTYIIWILYLNIYTILFIWIGKYCLRARFNEDYTILVYWIIPECTIMKWFVNSVKKNSSTIMLMSAAVLSRFHLVVWVHLAAVLRWTHDQLMISSNCGDTQDCLNMKLANNSDQSHMKRNYTMLHCNRWH